MFCLFSLFHLQSTLPVALQTNLQQLQLRSACWRGGQTFRNLWTTRIIQSFAAFGGWCRNGQQRSSKMLLSWPMEVQTFCGPTALRKAVDCWRLSCPMMMLEDVLKPPWMTSGPNLWRDLLTSRLSSSTAMKMQTLLRSHPCYLKKRHLTWLYWDC